MTPFEQDLQELTDQTVRMLSLVREAVELARRSLVGADPEAAVRGQRVEDEINDLQDQLESRILSVIARRQPAARDLRLLGATYRSLADIERAGDYAFHVSRAGAEMASEPPLKKYLDMDRILAIEIAMIDETARALAESDTEAARRGHAMDEEVDQLYEQIQRELITYMIEDPRTITKATRLLGVARHLERLGDHLENVDEHILFWLTGRRG
ncbi:MAG: phosphate signaling complex protein PhoU [Trueperaceae bacterium]|nr:phosphate signaling complex protein PhoU [Trueperaceae bacterium]